jgi:hypothetical protein
MDREKKHVYCHAFLYANGFPHAHPYLDAHAEQHAPSNVYGFADSNPTPHNYFNTHTYPASHMDGFPNPYPGDTERYLDPFADADTASHHYPFLDSHTHFDPNPLKTVVIPHML